MAEHPERIKTIEELPSEFSTAQVEGAERVFALREQKAITSDVLIPQQDIIVPPTPVASVIVGMFGHLEPGE